jgi:hypothetical protein
MHLKGKLIIYVIFLINLIIYALFVALNHQNTNKFYSPHIYIAPLLRFSKDFI